MTDIAVSSRGLLAAFSAAGVLTWGDVHPAQQLAHLFGEADERVHLALALTVRALRSGSICLEWARVRELGLGEDAVADVPEVLWPEESGWLDALRASPAVTVGDGAPGQRPLRFADDALYLERHFGDQEAVRLGLLARLAAAVEPVPIEPVPVEPAPAPPAEAVPASGATDEQQAAILLALGQRVSVIAGGPGTGKTHTIRLLIEQLRATEPDALVALAAPTGKAAARMTASLRSVGLTAATLHTLLGWRPDSRNRFVHDATNPLPHDVVVVDEMSMVSMLLMSRLLAALKPTARLVLVGDPDQLASVDAGSVLADIARAPATQGVVARLERNHRFNRTIAALARAIRDGEPDAALAVLGAGGEEVSLADGPSAASRLRQRVVEPGVRLLEAAASGSVGSALAALDEHRLLCGHRRGPFGVQHWTRQVVAWLSEAAPELASEGEFATGRPVMVTANAPEFGLYNGDTGVLIADSATGPRAWFRQGDDLRSHSPFVVDGLTTVHAMTVHKAQGSQFAHVSVVLPPVGSPLLTRELLYTAVTRAESSVLLVGSADAVREAVTHPVRRMSGLARRLT
ncbi:exodeoxyribonuclease V subunit alpha [Propioniciclava sp.]|uniref:exodeoxyribonuclease V subunit alpha n=1 Tax=Propioniciclava sp. TaxID=2038686 RepID=UPI002604C435|nr:exodeoxyribonuclease V subunit alpha [Propioniciclava sp.]